MTDRIHRVRFDAGETSFTAKPLPTDLEKMRAPVVKAKPVKLKRNFWKKTPLGRTLTFKNKTLVKVFGLLAPFVGLPLGLDFAGIIELTNISGSEPMDLFIDAVTGILSSSPDWLVILVAILVIATPTVLGYLFKSLVVSERFKDELADVHTVLKKARSVESENGKDLSLAEKGMLFDELREAGEVLLNDNGITIDLDGDGVPGS